VLSSIFLVGGDLIGESFIGSLDSGLLSIIDNLVSGFFSISFAWISFDLNKV
jgi:hypothetical protein